MTTTAVEAANEVIRSIRRRMVTDLRERLVLLEVLVGDGAGQPIMDQARLLAVELVRCAEELQAAIGGAAIGPAIGSGRPKPIVAATGPVVATAVVEAASVRVARARVVQPRRPARSTRRQRQLLRGAKASAGRRVLRHNPASRADSHSRAALRGRAALQGRAA